MLPSCFFFHQAVAVPTFVPSGSTAKTFVAAIEIHRGEEVFSKYASAAASVSNSPPLSQSAPTPRITGLIRLNDVVIWSQGPVLLHPQPCAPSKFSA